MNFPLYDMLSDNVSKKGELVPLVKSSKEKLITNINKNMDETGYELIYSLIKAHHMNNNKDNLYKLPYNMKNLKLGLRVDLDNLPLTLQYILLEFIDRHLNKEEI